MRLTANDVKNIAKNFKTLTNGDLEIILIKVGDYRDLKLINNINKTEEKMGGMKTTREALEYIHGIFNGYRIAKERVYFKLGF